MEVRCQQCGYQGDDSEGQCLACGHPFSTMVTSGNVQTGTSTPQEYFDQGPRFSIPGMTRSLPYDAENQMTTSGNRSIRKPEGIPPDFIRTAGPPLYSAWSAIWPMMRSFLRFVQIYPLVRGVVVEEYSPYQREEKLGNGKYIIFFIALIFIALAINYKDIDNLITTLATPHSTGAAPAVGGISGGVILLAALVGALGLIWVWTEWDKAHANDGNKGNPANIRHLRIADPNEPDRMYEVTIAGHYYGGNIGPGDHITVWGYWDYITGTGTAGIIRLHYQRGRKSTSSIYSPHGLLSPYLAGVILVLAILIDLIIFWVPLHQLIH